MKLIHTCKTMTVREYCLFESDGNAKRLYRRGFGWIPVRFVHKDIQAFLFEFNTLFNASGDSYLDKQAERLQDHSRVLLLQAIAEGIQLHLVTRAQMEVIAKQVKYKLPADTKLPEYIELVKKHTGIEITTLEDVAAFKAELQRKIDKFNEKYPETKKEPEKKTSMLQLFTACCRIMEVTHDYTTMTLWEFSQFKRQAEEHSRRMEQAYNKPILNG